MKTLLVLALAIASSAAFARQDTTNLSCADASALVKDAGAIVLSTGTPSLYAKFVANSSYCGNEQAVAAYAATLDNANCKIGYVCQVGDRGGNSVSKKFPSSITVCKEGAKGFARADAYFNINSDKVPNISVVCKAGKWVPANAAWAPSKTVGGLKCADGAISYYPAPDRGNMTGVTTYVCKAGKWYVK